jgi:hypothetical protein
MNNGSGRGASLPALRKAAERYVPYRPTVPAALGRQNVHIINKFWLT